MNVPTCVCITPRYVRNLTSVYTNVVWKVGGGGRRFTVGIPICLLRVGERVRLTSPLFALRSPFHDRAKKCSPPRLFLCAAHRCRTYIRARNRSTGDDERSRGKRLIRRTKIDCTVGVRSFPAVPRFTADDEIHSRSCD